MSEPVRSPDNAQEGVQRWVAETTQAQQMRRQRAEAFSPATQEPDRGRALSLSRATSSSRDSDGHRRPKSSGRRRHREREHERERTPPPPIPFIPPGFVYTPSRARSVPPRSRTASVPPPSNAHVSGQLQRYVPPLPPPSAAYQYTPRGPPPPLYTVRRPTTALPPQSRPGYVIPPAQLVYPAIIAYTPAPQPIVYNYHQNTTNVYGYHLPSPWSQQPGSPAPPPLAGVPMYAPAPGSVWSPPPKQPNLLKRIFKLGGGDKSAQEESRASSRGRSRSRSRSRSPDMY
ncbi:hypothetical protein C8F01DRAFT_1300906 [Mycena amicta]|nr:hypothetical protein C8F01DRAFT_1300906 [Mycena amicta]